MKKMMIIIIIFMLVESRFFCEKTTAPKEVQTDDDQWTTYTTADGLPYNTVAAIAFGPDGDIWCVPILQDAGAGIAHFDGKTWKHYTTKDGLGADFIIWMENTLAVSPEGVLWVGTFGGGVSRFDGKTWTTYTTKDGLLSDKVTAVAIAPNGDLWCTHPASVCGISHFDGEKWSVSAAGGLGLASCNLVNIAFAPNGTLWAGGSNSVVRRNGETWSSFGSAAGLKVPVALNMDIGSNGRVWVSGGGVSCYANNTWTHYSFEKIGAKANDSGIVPLAVDAENVLWVGVYGSGIFRYDSKSWSKFTPKDGPALTNVWSITVAPDGAIWFGTDDGISRYQP